LKLLLNPNKVFIKTLASGTDFLGWVNFHEYRTLRTNTKRRMMEKLKKNPKPESVVSYLEMLSHGSTEKLYKEIEEIEKHLQNS